MSVGARSDTTTGEVGTVPRRPNSHAAPPDSSASATDAAASCGTVKENRLTTGRVFERADSPIRAATAGQDRKSTRLNSSHLVISYAVFCLKKKKNYA